MRKKKLLSAVFALAMAVFAIPAFAHAAEESPVWQDGTWEGTQWGYSSDITMAVTIADGKITNVEAKSQDETPTYWYLIQDEEGCPLFDAIIEKQSTSVDTVSGATISSTAILGAVDQALAKAAGLETAVTEPQAEWFAGGTGTESDPFLIATPQQLYRVADSMNGDIRYSGMHLALAADLDMSGIVWRPIGSNSFPFAGHFDGAGHVIRNLQMGTSVKEPYAARTNSRHLGLFGMVDKGALIENVNLENAVIYAQGEEVSVRTGLIAGQTKGGIFRNVSASGMIWSESDGGNDVCGGLIGFNGGGVLINAAADVDITSLCNKNYDESGGLAGYNEGLIANCSASGNVTAGGAASIIASALVGEQCGDVVNCITSGNLTVEKATSMAGMTSGDIDGGRTYNCWYKGTAVMTVAGEKVTPKDYGMTYAKAMDYDGIYYSGNMVLNLKAYNLNHMDSVVSELNETLAKFPVDPAKHGVSEESFRTWAVSGKNAVLTNEAVAVTYVRPEEENVPQVEQEMKDGTWYGRSSDKSVVVKIQTEKNAVAKVETLAGADSGDAYDEAVKVASLKAVYQDGSTYEPADPSKFAGGKGTKEDPYLVANEAQLRYIAEAVNEDVDWADVWFRQTADIQLSDREWLPIGYSVFGYYRSRWTSFKDYPFRGNFDGHEITGLRIGTADAPTADPRMVYTAGMFGYVEGTVTQNYALSMLKDVTQREIRNVRVKDMIINAANENGLYAGGLIGRPLNGFKADHCIVSGQLTAAVKGGTLYAGGLMGYGLRGGLVTNCRTEVTVNASADRDSSANVYAGGFYGYDNRVTTVNSCALGSIAADGPAKRLYAGGFAGACAGANYNVFAMGSVTAGNDTTTLGALAGNLYAIGAYYHASANGDAAQTVNGSAKAEKSLYGASGADRSRDRSALRKASEMNGSALAKEMNAAITTVKAELAEMQEGIGDDPIHAVYYTGDGSDLLTWKTGDTSLIFAADAKAAPSGETAAKKANPMTVKAAGKTFKAKKLKKKAASYKAVTVARAQGPVAYKVTYGNAKAKKALKFNQKTGKITVKKKTKKGTYKLTLQIKAAGNASYEASGVVKKTITIRVK
ncbi:MAG: FMN-binding protein [Firmicutes bacterium]|nr:FMN-binding protein [Bacillota bacterium]